MSIPRVSVSAKFNNNLLLCVLRLPLSTEDEVGMMHVFCIGGLSCHPPFCCLFSEAISLHHPPQHLLKTDCHHERDGGREGEGRKEERRGREREREKGREGGRERGKGK